jgi:hypothetical protein
MAKGDELAPNIGWNPGGMRMGGQATIGSRPMPNPVMGGMGMNAGGIAPSMGAMGQMMGQQMQGGQGMMKPAVEPMRATGNMIPNQQQQQGGVGPSNFNPMEAIQRMINMRTQGTSTTTPIQPNSYALNPSANMFSGGRNQQI